MDADASFHDYYADLNLQLGAPPTSIKAAYNTLVLLTHPDKTGNPDSTAFRVVQEAYKKLSDDEFRTAYDKNYWRRKLHTDPPGTENYTRTAEYEAEEQRRRARSPPPKQPAQKYNEPSYKYFFGKSYLGWQKRMAAWRARHPEWAEK
jgi:curved DNA-binding protein CbpA